MERGKYLAVLGGCNDCHTPKIPGPEGAPVPDNTKLLSGHAANSPARAWSPDDMKQKNVAATEKRIIDRLGGYLGSELRDEFDAG